jgi:hypothetical protein
LVSKGSRFLNIAFGPLQEALQCKVFVLRSDEELMPKGNYGNPYPDNLQDDGHKECGRALPSGRVCEEIDQEGCTHAQKIYHTGILGKLKGWPVGQLRYVSEGEQLLHVFLGILLVNQFLQKERVSGSRIERDVRVCGW